MNYAAVDSWVGVREVQVSLARAGVRDTSVGQTVVPPWISMAYSEVSSQGRPILLEAMSEVVLNAAYNSLAKRKRVALKQFLMKPSAWSSPIRDFCAVSSMTTDPVDRGLTNLFGCRPVLLRVCGLRVLAARIIFGEPNQEVNARDR